MKAAATGGCLVIFIWLACIIGWFANLFQVVGFALSDSEATTLFFVKVVGIFAAPLGAIMGWCQILF